MARRAKTENESLRSVTVTDSTAPTTAVAVRSKALVFISHDSRDGEIAEAFGNLLRDVSVGTLKTFRSSDNLGTSGIPFGDEWYDAVISKLSEATDVVALLTKTSIDRPWILYEAGIAAGKLGTRVIGVAIGLPLSKAITGPFSQFQNSADDEQSLTKLMLQLLQRNPDAAPRQETVALHVKAFRETIGNILKAKGGGDDSAPPSEEENVAKLVEDIKGMLRELPDRVGDRANSLIPRGGPRRRRIHFKFIEEIAFGKPFRHFRNGPALALLTIVSMLRDDAPWLYEPAAEFYRLVTSKARHPIKEATLQMHELVEFSMRGPIGEWLAEDSRLAFSPEILHELIERAARDRPRSRSISPEK
jgi:hypothetical protein